MQIITNSKESRQLRSDQSEEVRHSEGNPAEVKQIWATPDIKYRTETTDEMTFKAGELQAIAYSIRGIFTQLQTDIPSDPETMENIGLFFFESLLSIAESLKTL